MVDESVPAPDFDGIPLAKDLLRRIRSGALATLDREGGFPFASLVTVATDLAGAPLLLMSRLSEHTRNLEADPRASILLAESGKGDPLAHPRLTVIGEVSRCTDPKVRERFLARHPSAGGYVDFGDFSIYTLRVSSGHFIGGFGRIFTIEAPALLTAVESARTLIDAEPDIIAHMNKDHADAVALYATELAGCPAGDWRMCGIDPEGADLLQRTKAARIDFPNRIASPAEARQMLVALVQQARSKQSTCT